MGLQRHGLTRLHHRDAAERIPAVDPHQAGPALPLEAGRGPAGKAGIERMDFTKGIADRFRALDLFFERNREWRGRVSFVQVAAPSASRTSSASFTISSARRWDRYSACWAALRPASGSVPVLEIGVERPVPRWSSSTTW